MNIIIATLQGRNYGGRLQNYALLQTLKKMSGEGGRVESLIWDHGKNPLYPSLISRCRQYSPLSMFKKWIQMRIEKAHKKKVDALLKQRFALFDAFIDATLCRTKRQKIKDRQNWGGQFDTLVIGSDQVWNPNAMCDVYVGEHSYIGHRISYAASIGRGVLSDYELSYMIPRINQLDAISVREKSAKEILVKGGVAKDIKVVVDPTMLLTPKEWDAVVAERMIAEPYVFVYSFSDCKLKHQIVEKYKAEGKRVVFIPYAKRVWNSYDGKSPMEALYDVGPREFLSLIKYADQVFTDSFHGAVFSILYNKPFHVYQRSKGGKTSMNSRIYDLLSTLGLEERMIGSELPAGNQVIDYEAVNAKIDELRTDSLNWLANNIRKQDDKHN